MKKMIYLLAVIVALIAIAGCSEQAADRASMSAKTCGTCHALPPNDSYHALYYSSTGAKGISCSNCHTGYAADSSLNQFYVNSETHMDGIAEGSYVASKVTCGGCHSVPPRDHGHTYHVDTLHYACSHCHAGTAADSVSGLYAVNQLTHMNGDTNVVFTAPWDDGGKASYDKATKQCSNVYCHGGIPQGTHMTVAWTADSVNRTCAACHNFSTTTTDTASSIYLFHYGHAYKKRPATGTAIVGGNVNRCYSCHDSTYNVAQNTVDPVKHINGIFDQGTCGACHTWNTWQEYKQQNP
jgi:predicted CxxxxCH...CXXCH cytochrome family protein